MKALLKLDSMGNYEKEQGFASYRTLVDRFIGNIILCNNIYEIEGYSLNENIQVGNLDEDTEIYQYFLCNVSEWSIETLKELTKDNNDIILSYSDKLECNVLMVDHFGTSWDYVLTSVPLVDNIEDCGI